MSHLLHQVWICWPLSAAITLDQPQLDLPATPTETRSPLSTQPRAVMPWLSGSGGLLLSYPCLRLHLFFTMGLIDPDCNQQIEILVVVNLPDHH